MSHQDPATTSPTASGGFVRLLDRLANNPGRVFLGLGLVCLLLALADLAYHKHAYYSFEALPFFYPVFGFAIYTLVIFLAKGLRRLIRRPQSYYAPYSVDDEDSTDDITGARG